MAMGNVQVLKIRMADDSVFSECLFNAVISRLFNAAAGTTDCMRLIIYSWKQPSGISLLSSLSIYDGHTGGCSVLDIWQGRLILNVVQYKIGLLSSGWTDG